MILVGQRAKLHYNYLGCTAKITCFKSAKSTQVKITEMCLEHNHELNRVAYLTTGLELSEQEKEVLTDLRDANCKVSQISRVFHKKFDKVLSSPKI